MTLPSIYFLQYTARHRMGAFPAFYDLSNPVFWPPLTLAFPLFPLLFTSKSVRSLKGRRILITILDTKLSFMSPPRQYYLYFNTSEYSHQAVSSLVCDLFSAVAKCHKKPALPGRQSFPATPPVVFDVAHCVSMKSTRNRQALGRHALFWCIPLKKKHQTSHQPFSPGANFRSE